MSTSQTGSTSSQAWSKRAKRTSVRGYKAKEEVTIYHLVVRMAVLAATFRPTSQLMVPRGGIREQVPKAAILEMEPMTKSNKLSSEAKLEASIRLLQSLPPQNKMQSNDGQLADPMFSATLQPTVALDAEPIHLAG